jgi:hypothetical protein
MKNLKLKKKTTDVTATKPGYKKIGTESGDKTHFFYILPKCTIR